MASIICHTAANQQIRAGLELYTFTLVSNEIKSFVPTNEALLVESTEKCELIIPRFDRRGGPPACSCHNERYIVKSFFL